VSEKLQKILARAGLGSRREIEEWISNGRVSVNGSIAKLGDRATRDDKIRVNSRIIKSEHLFPDKRRVIIYHKPIGEICTRNDPENRDTIFEHLPKIRAGRWIAVGRLDINTSGLILLTTDGELANRLMHPSTEVEREYAVRVLGEVSDATLECLKKGVELEDGSAHFSNIVDAGGQGANHWYHVVLKEGRNREVRRMWESQGVTVSRLMRTRYGPIILRRGQRQGRWEELSESETNALLQLADMPVEKKPVPSKGSMAGKRVKGRSKKVGIQKKRVGKKAR
jgi:23S rRNA pseudouridine2605 synthase